MKTIIHVNRHTIRKNKSGSDDPPLTIKTYKSQRNAKTVEILGPCRVVYRPEKPLGCGAVVWIETESAVVVDGLVDKRGQTWTNENKRRTGQGIFSR